ncbi:hypothetical protein HanXRQr2_Chr04g0159271 [Helianthus annuus]|uniref:Uncharacterized protein n=1 Tax=Helianthus annuus TaxID=4232 RepID=A0A9K3NR03_HELAN|nr:hypothetical protein HanXRQr2_Chr04g0159271 [Helianthus annuus]KAJ0930775.1 hypothetical protein HanPSC8_Chr04g0153331 [Helianthus annuus]
MTRQRSLAVNTLANLIGLKSMEHPGFEPVTSRQWEASRDTKWVSVTTEPRPSGYLE